MAMEAARLLHDARITGSTLDALPEACRPKDVDDAYAVQDALVARIGCRVVGWKLGATTPYWQKRARLQEPMAGRLFDSMMYQGHAILPGCAFHLRMVECEYAFRLGVDLPPRAQPYSLDDIYDAVDAVYGCVEVADSRYTRGIMVDSPSLIADNVLAGAYIVGPEISGWRDVDLVNAPVRVHSLGKVLAEGKGEHTGGHPILPLVWLANDRRKRGDGLRAGMLVSTSSTTGAYRSPPVAEITAEYAPFGEVRLAFTG